jgi:hypothetical protein
MRYGRRVVAAVVAACALVLIALGATPARAAAPGQIDDFESGSVLNWQNSTTVLDPPPDPPPHPGVARNIPTGGPAGADDNFLRIGSTGAGAGGKLVVFNLAQWTGNYLAQGVNGISMHVRNEGDTDLTLRLILVKTQFVEALCTVEGVVLDADDDGWQLVTFPLTAANLTGGDFNSVMSGVTELNLVHSPTAVTHRQQSPNYVAQLGFDNVTALPVPEPASASAGAAVLFAALRRGGRRRASESVMV